MNAPSLRLARRLCLALVLLLGRLPLAVAATPPSPADPGTVVLNDDQIKACLDVAALRANNPRKQYDLATFRLKHDLNHPGMPVTVKEVAGYDPPTSPFPTNPSPTNLGIPIKVGHGMFDDLQSDGLGNLVRQVKIRASFDDVLTGEDPSVNIGQDKENSVSDLTGAAFSYSRNLRADTDSWSAKGAFILPFSEVRDTRGSSEYDMRLKSYGFAPSVSFDREVSADTPSSDADSLVFRLGAFAKWLGPSPYLTSLTLRVFGSYGTDFGFHSEIPAGELELEPVVQGKGWLGIGSRHFLVRTNDEQAKAFSLTNIAYQLRVIFHAQYGRVNDAAGTGLADADFLRVGPRLKLRLDPLFTPQFTCDISYDYQADVIGESKNHGLLSIAPALILNKPPADATTLDEPLIKLTASYQNGGLDLTKARVHTILIGLGVTY